MPTAPSTHGAGWLQCSELTGRNWSSYEKQWLHSSPRKSSYSFLTLGRPLPRSAPNYRLSCLLLLLFCFLRSKENAVWSKWMQKFLSPGWLTHFLSWSHCCPLCIVTDSKHQTDQARHYKWKRTWKGSNMGKNGSSTWKKNSKCNEEFASSWMWQHKYTSVPGHKFLPCLPQTPREKLFYGQWLVTGQSGLQVVNIIAGAGEWEVNWLLSTLISLLNTTLQTQSPSAHRWTSFKSCD